VQTASWLFNAACSSAQAALMAGSSNQIPPKPKAYAMVLLSLRYGLRCSEATGLSLGHVDLKTQQTGAPPAGGGRTKKPQVLLPALSAFRPRAPEKSLDYRTEIAPPLAKTQARVRTIPAAAGGRRPDNKTAAPTPRPISATDSPRGVKKASF
jgi:hypothetical protein